MSSMSESSLGPRASGLPRRDIFKTLGSTLLASAAVSLFRPQQAAAQQSSAPTVAHPSGDASSVTLNFKLPTGDFPQLMLPDRFPGRITFPGRPAFIIVPHIDHATERVEVSLYNSRTMDLLKRIDLPFRRGTAIERVAIESDAFPALSVGVVRVRQMP